MTRIEQLESRRLLDARPLGAEFRVNTTTTSDQFAPAVASDNAGNFVVVWAGDSNPATHAPDTDIFLQRYNSAGSPLGGEVRVNTFTTGIQANPSVAMDADGDFVVVWESGPADTGIDPGQDGSGFGIYAQRYNAAGAAQGGEFRINGTTADDQRAPRVASDANGNFVVAWHSANQDGSGFGVYARRYNNAGTALAAEFRANVFTTDNQLYPSVAVDSTGDFVVTWTSGNLNASNTQDGSFYGIYAQRYNAAGAVQGSEFRVNTFTTDFQTFSSVAMDSAGNFVVSWSSFGQDGSDYGIYAKRYNAAGAVQGSEFKVNTFIAGTQSQSMVDMDNSGNFVVVWASDLQDGSGRGAFGQLYDSSGVAQGAEFRINTFTPNDQKRPAVAFGGTSTTFVAAYEDGSSTVGVNGQDGSGYGVYTRRYSIAPRVNSANFDFATTHAVSIAFSENVSATLTTADVQVVNLTTNTTIATAAMALAYNAITNTATVTFPGITTNGHAGILPDGNYRVTLLAAGITNGNGVALDGDGNGTGGDNFTFDFFVWAGDANHDRTVNLTDFNTLASNFGQSGRNFTQGDFNYDGIVNLSDFNILASKFGQTLNPPAESTPSSAVAPRGGSTFSSRRIKDPNGEPPVSQ
jgi:hypothetical protein